MTFQRCQAMEGTLSQLDLFAPLPIQASILEGEFEYYKPLASLSDDVPIEFLVINSGSQYIDPAHTSLHLTVSITDENGAYFAGDADANISTSNLLLHSLFESVKLELNGKQVSASSEDYAYKAYIETVATYGPTAKESHLTSALDYKDTTGQFTAAANTGFVTRASFF